MKMPEIEELIHSYLNSFSVVIVEMALEKLILHTDNSNYLEIISIIEMGINVSELDLSMYISGIASPDYKELINIIDDKLTCFKDKDAINDLNEALAKVN